MANTWTKEDQEQLYALTLKKETFEQDIRCEILTVVDKFYYSDMYVSDLVVKLQEYSADLIPVLQKYLDTRIK